MFYKIDNDYYVLVGSKYVLVKFEIIGNEIIAKPLNKKIEKSDGLKIIDQPFDDLFKKEIMNKLHSTNEKKENEIKKQTRSGKKNGYGKRTS